MHADRQRADFVDVCVRVFAGCSQHRGLSGVEFQETGCLFVWVFFFSAGECWPLLSPGCACASLSVRRAVMQVCVRSQACRSVSAGFLVRLYACMYNGSHALSCKNSHVDRVIKADISHVHIHGVHPTLADTSQFTSI